MFRITRPLNSFMETKFRTSQRVIILDIRGLPFMTGAIVRSFNEVTKEYYLTFRGEEGETESFYVPEERLQIA